MGVFDSLIGSGSIGETLLVWGILQNVISSAMAPFMEALQSEVNSVHPENPLSPAQLADMVIKNILDQDTAAAEANKSGISNANFGHMVLDTGEPPGLTDVLLMWRRGIIQEGPDTPGVASVDAAIRTSRLRDEWADAIKASKVVPITAADAVDAVLRNQIAHDQGAAIAFQNGIQNTDFDVLLNTSGNPPSLTELLELARRGIIPWGDLTPSQSAPDPTATTFAQGIYEGNTKDKWLPFYAKLGDYIPPPRTITTLVNHGVISEQTAMQLFQANGLSPELAAAYFASATASKTIAQKELTVSDVLTGYQDGLVSQAEASSMLGDLGYTTAEQGFLINLQDFKRALTQLNTAISRIRTYYVSHKLIRTTAVDALQKLGLPTAQVDTLMGQWDLEQSLTVRLLTEAQIVDAFAYSIFDQQTAQNELQAIGYTAYDAWVLLSVKNKAPLPGQPDNTASPVTGLP